MRVGEIIVLSTHPNDKRLFVESVCNRLDNAGEDFTFGRLTINDQLELHLYGITIQPDTASVSWDMVARKMLGCVVLFPWQDQESFERIKPVIDQIAGRHHAAIVVAAHVNGEFIPVLPEIYDRGIFLGSKGKFTFCDFAEPDSAKLTLVTLLDMLIDRQQ